MIAFLVHSGFPEAIHSRYVERYLITLTKKLNSPYLGTLVHGGSEGIRMKPDFLNRKIFTNLIQAGKQLALQGGIEDRTISACSKIEMNSPLRAFFLRGLYRLPSAHWYWNTKLKKNGAYADRFAQPYIE